MDNTLPGPVAPRHGAHPVPQLIHALLARPAFGSLVVPAQIFKALVEMNDSGLFRAQLQSQPVKYLADEFQCLFGFFPALAQGHDIVRITDPCRASFLQGQVQIMEKDIGQDRRDDSPYAKDNLTFERILKYR